MKKYIYALASCILLTCFIACNKEDYSNREYYKYVVYLLSKENYNVYPDVFPFDEGKEVTRYFSVCCSGSLINPDEFTVELETDTILFNQYNRMNFDIDTSKFAHHLSKDMYRIETYTVKFPARNTDPYMKVAVSVIPDKLSPDSIYFIPLSIKSVSNYEVNPNKKNILFRVAVENYYAEQLKDTYYQLKGNKLNAAGEAIGGISGSKLARPISKNSVRLYAGNENQTNKSTVEEINKYSILLTVDENKKVKISPYGSIEIEQYDTENWNRYEEIRKNAVDLSVNKYFNLYYRYRTVKTPTTDKKPAVYNDWVIVQETLKRLES